MAFQLKKVIDKLPALKVSFAEMSKHEVLVGVPSEKAERKDGEINNAALAYMNDKGSPANNIPPRPFMEPGIKNASAKLSGIFKSAAKNALNAGGNTEILENAMNKAGLEAQASIRAVINEGEFKDLSESTIKARERRGRKSRKPLVDTGQLRNSISYVVVKKG